jgi:hypothetical protein
LACSRAAPQPSESAPFLGTATVTADAICRPKRKEPLATD